MPVVAQLAEEVTRMLAPIDPAVPAGLFDVEDETYQAIDQEMVKLGGLQDATLDWVYIEEASRQYLSQQCKHLRIVAHLSAAWLRSGCWARWGSTLALLAGMIERYWETAHPKPGPKGFLVKRKLVGLVINRMAEALPRLDRFTYTPSHAAAAQAALKRLQQQAMVQLEPDALCELERLLRQHTELANGVGEAGVPEAPAPSVKRVPLADVLTTPMPRVAVGNERETRRAVLAMAELINEQDPYDATGYQLRRFGLWAHIETAPQIRQGNRTELMAVPPDITRVYEGAIASTAIDPVLLQRIERSVTACPYWIRGSFLASTVATRLAMGEVAEAIRSATARFVQRMPALQQLCFSDGRVFVDDQSLAWLKGTQGPCAQGITPSEFGGLREELAGQLQTVGVEPVLLRLQALQADLRSPRERCHTTMIAADLLATRGVSWLAQDLCTSVARAMQHTTASAWEPEVFQRLQQYAEPSALTEQHKEQ